MNTSFNGKIICKPYEGKRKIEAQVKSGFATVKQKNTVVGLEVLANAYISEDVTIFKGATVFVSEEFLFNSQSVLKPMECDAIEGQFILIDFGYILFVKGK